MKFILDNDLIIYTISSGGTPTFHLKSWYNFHLKLTLLPLLLRGGVPLCAFCDYFGAVLDFLSLAF